jgi:hypothetical protein
MHMIRLLPILALVLSFASPAAAQWCAHMNRGATNCGFRTYEQCRANVSGLGGSCQPDTQYTPGESSAPARAKAPAAKGANWCSHDTLGGVNCGFPTYQQCLKNIAGLGGSCQRNTQR